MASGSFAPLRLCVLALNPTEPETPVPGLINPTTRFNAKTQGRKDAKAKGIGRVGRVCPQRAARPAGRATGALRTALPTSFLCASVSSRPCVNPSEPEMPVSARLSSGRAVLRLARPLLPAGRAVLSPATTVLSLGKPVLPLGNGLLPAGAAVLWLGRPVLRLGRALLSPGRALIWFGWALICAPSAFPDGFYVLLADSGQNSGRPWSKRDSFGHPASDGDSLTSISGSHIPHLHRHIPARRR